MATISNRNNKWHGRVRRSGQPTVAKTFLIRTDAEKWARSIEIEIDRGSYINASFAQKTLFKEILQKYLDDVAPNMRSADTQAIRVKKLMRHPIAERGWSFPSLTIARQEFEIAIGNALDWS